MLNEIEKYIARETLIFKGAIQSTGWFFVIWRDSNLTVVWNIPNEYVVDAYGGFYNTDNFSFGGDDEQFMAEIIKEYIIHSKDTRNVM